MSAGVTVRTLTEDDVPALTALLVANRDHLAPWDPQRADEYFTEEFQRSDTARLLEVHRQGGVLPGVVLLDGEPVGRINVDNVVRGAFLSGDLGYWVAEHVTGRGVATAAVAAMTRLAFGEAGLHRLQQARCCTTAPRSGCSGATGSPRSASPRGTCASRGSGRTTCCSSC